MNGFCEVASCGRKTHAKGLCNKHYRSVLYKQGRIKPTLSTPTKNANHTLKLGRTLKPPHKSPYRAIARTCPKCGNLITTPPELIRKDAGSLPRCHGCHIRSVRLVKKKRAAIDPEFAKKLKQMSATTMRRSQAKTLGGATSWGNEWTGVELELAARKDLSSRQLAIMLGRTLYAVKGIRGKIKAEDPRTMILLGERDM